MGLPSCSLAAATVSSHPELSSSEYWRDPAYKSIFSVEPLKLWTLYLNTNFISLPPTLADDEDEFLPLQFLDLIL